jgi:hypothetical protein
MLDIAVSPCSSREATIAVGVGIQNGGGLAKQNRFWTLIVPSSGEPVILVMPIAARLNSYSTDCREPSLTPRLSKTLGLSA